MTPNKANYDGFAWIKYNIEFFLLTTKYIQRCTGIPNDFLEHLSTLLATAEKHPTPGLLRSESTYLLNGFLFYDRFLMNELRNFWSKGSSSPGRVIVGVAYTEAAPFSCWLSTLRSFTLTNCICDTLLAKREYLIFKRETLTSFLMGGWTLPFKSWCGCLIFTKKKQIFLEPERKHEAFFQSSKTPEHFFSRQKKEVELVSFSLFFSFAFLRDFQRTHRRHTSLYEYAFNFFFFFYSTYVLLKHT